MNKKKREIQWTTEQQEAFEKLQESLTNPPVLAFPNDKGGTFILDTDASWDTISGIISQVQTGQEKVIDNGSNILNQAQTNYCTTKRELLAEVHFVQA